MSTAPTAGGSVMPAKDRGHRDGGHVVAGGPAVLDHRLRDAVLDRFRVGGGWRVGVGDDVAAYVDSLLLIIIA